MISIQHRWLPIMFLLAGCSSSGQPDEQPHAAKQPEALLASFTSGGHLIELWGSPAGALTIAERSAIGEPSVLEGLPVFDSVAGFYSHFVGGEVPRAIRDFDARAHVLLSSPNAVSTARDQAEAQRGGAPQSALTGPGLAPRHENGSVHFRSSHCPTAPMAGTLMATFPNPPGSGIGWVAPRLFCWSGDQIGDWTEWANAGTLFHKVAAVVGSICYTGQDDTSVNTRTILQGEQWSFNRVNTPILWNVSCPRGSICSNPRGNRTAPMSATVGCTQGGSVWRWGGGFFAVDPARFTPR